MSAAAGSTRQLIHRISGIEGHVRSVKRMLEEERDTLEILMQISAIRAALNRLSHVLFEELVEARLQAARSEEERAAAIADIRAAMETLP